MTDFDLTEHQFENVFKAMTREEPLREWMTKRTTNKYALYTQRPSIMLRHKKNYSLDFENWETFTFPVERNLLQTLHDVAYANNKYFEDYVHLMLRKAVNDGRLTEDIWNQWDFADMLHDNNETYYDHFRDVSIFLSTRVINKLGKFDMYRKAYMFLKAAIILPDYHNLSWASKYSQLRIPIDIRETIQLRCGRYDERLQNAEKLILTKIAQDSPYFQDDPKYQLAA